MKTKNTFILCSIIFMFFIYTSIISTNIAEGACVKKHTKIKKHIDIKKHKKVRKHKKIRKKVMLTAYTISKNECGKTDGITAYDGKAVPWKTAAVGDDLRSHKKRYVYIPKLKKKFYINDRKKTGYKGIDVCVRTKKEAMEIGNELTEVVFF